MKETQPETDIEKAAEAAAYNIHLEYMRTDATELTLRDTLIKAYKQGRLDEKDVPDLSEEYEEIASRISYYPSTNLEHIEIGKLEILDELKERGVITLNKIDNDD